LYYRKLIVLLVQIELIINLFSDHTVPAPLMMLNVRYDVDLGTSYWPIKKRISMIDIHCNPMIVINKIVESYI